MAEHPAVAFLTATWARVEETARAAGGGHVEAVDYLWEAKYLNVRHPDGTVTHTTEFSAELADHFALHGPAAALRLVAGARQILVEHPLLRRAYSAADGTCFCCGKPLPSEPFELVWCGTCHDEDDAGFEAYWHGSRGGPCRTVLLLAQAWGWTEETR